MQLLARRHIAPEAIMDEIAEMFNAVAVSDADTVRRLLAADASLARASNADRLPVCRFAKFMGNEAILRALLDAGPPLTLMEAAMVDDTARIAAVLDAEPSAVRAWSEDGFTALHFAVYYGAIAAARLLLDRGADMEAVTTNFLANMPIHAAAAGAARYEACALLLERGAAVNARQHDGYTALHTPAMHGDRAMVELFLRHGADPGAANDSGDTPADLARSQGHADIAALLRGRAARGGGDL
jgi:ankyrin repeat protein